MAEATRLEALGARRLGFLPADDENECCVVMQDIEGNEFCRERQKRLTVAPDGNTLQF